MQKRAIFDASTGLTTLVDASNEIINEPMSLEELRAVRLNELSDHHSASLLGSFVSSATGTPITYSYDKDAQFIYSKWANVLSLDTTKDSVFFDSVSHARITMTRAQFMTFMNDAEANEIQLYDNFKTSESAIYAATTKDELMSIQF